MAFHTQLQNLRKAMYYRHNQMMEDMKKQMRKKITSILIMLIMVITLFPTRVTVQAGDELATAGTGKYNDYEYRVNDKNEVIITNIPELRQM